MVTAMDNVMLVKSKSQPRAGVVFQESLAQEGVAAVAKPCVVRWAPITVSLITVTGAKECKCNSPSI